MTEADLFDRSTEFGRRVAKRLDRDEIIWLTTVDGSGSPQPRPVWFLYADGAFLIFSQPDTYKLFHLRNNARVALNFDGDARGGDIIVFTGRGEIVSEAFSDPLLSGYIEKYRDGIERIGMTPQSFLESYSVAIRVVPEEVRGH